MGTLIYRSAFGVGIFDTSSNLGFAEANAIALVVVLGAALGALQLWNRRRALACSWASRRGEPNVLSCHRADPSTGHRRGIRWMAGRAGIQAVLLLSSAFSLIPILFTVFASLRSDSSFFGSPFSLAGGVALSNYTQAWSPRRFWQMAC